MQDIIKAKPTIVLRRPLQSTPDSFSDLGGGRNIWKLTTQPTEFDIMMSNQRVLLDKIHTIIEEQKKLTKDR